MALAGAGNPPDGWAVVKGQWGAGISAVATTPATPPTLMSPNAIAITGANITIVSPMIPLPSYLATNGLPTPSAARLFCQASASTVNVTVNYNIYLADKKTNFGASPVTLFSGAWTPAVNTWLEESCVFNATGAAQNLFMQLSVTTNSTHVGTFYFTSGALFTSRPYWSNLVATGVALTTGGTNVPFTFGTSIAGGMWGEMAFGGSTPNANIFVYRQGVYRFELMVKATAVNALGSQFNAKIITSHGTVWPDASVATNFIWVPNTNLSQSIAGTFSLDSTTLGASGVAPIGPFTVVIGTNNSGTVSCEFSGSLISA